MHDEYIYAGSHWVNNIHIPIKNKNHWSGVSYQQDTTKTVIIVLVDFYRKNLPSGHVGKIRNPQHAGRQCMELVLCQILVDRGVSDQHFTRLPRIMPFRIPCWGVNCSIAQRATLVPSCLNWCQRLRVPYGSPHRHASDRRPDQRSSRCPYPPSVLLPGLGSLSRCVLIAVRCQQIRSLHARSVVMIDRVRCRRYSPEDRDRQVSTPCGDGWTSVSADAKIIKVLLNRLTHYYGIIKKGNETLRFKNRNWVHIHIRVSVSVCLWFQETGCVFDKGLILHADWQVWWPLMGYIKCIFIQSSYNICAIKYCLLITIFMNL